MMRLWTFLLLGDLVAVGKEWRRGWEGKGVMAKGEGSREREMRRWPHTHTQAHMHDTQ